MPKTKRPFTASNLKFDQKSENVIKGFVEFIRN